MANSTLAFVYCQVCETRQWFRDGQPIDLAAVKDEASATFNRKSKRAPELLSA